MLYQSRAHCPSAIVGLDHLVNGIMLTEHAHRVANDMSVAVAALRLCHRQVSEEATRTVLAQTIDRLLELADVQRSLLKPAASHIDLDQMLAHLAKSIMKAHASPLRVRLALRLDKVRMSSNMAWRLSTVLAELLTNAIKHGFVDRGGTVRVSLTSRPSGLRLTVADDGRGAGDWRSTSSGHGSGIVRAIVAELGGDLTRTTSAAGTTVKVDLPGPAASRERVDALFANHAAQFFEQQQPIFHSSCRSAGQQPAHGGALEATIQSNHGGRTCVPTCVTLEASARPAS